MPGTERGSGAVWRRHPAGRFLSRRLRERVKGLIPRALLTRELRDRRARQVLFTFDDGPNHEVTPRVLDLLHHHRTRAVFFVVGRRVTEAPEVLQRIRSDGHRIGNHSFAHRRPPVREYVADLIQCQDLVRSYTGVVPDLYRPPGGYVSPATLAIPPLFGLRTIQWSLDVRDSACRTREDALEAARELEETIQPGHIVLLHDDHQGVVDILEYTLPRLKARGFDLSSAAGRV
jgi:peptidoglycan/xylan/chitin deacetylase (PgdA/CDA1 family)